MWTYRHLGAGTRLLKHLESAYQELQSSLCSMERAHSTPSLQMAQQAQCHINSVQNLAERLEASIGSFVLQNHQHVRPLYQLFGDFARARLAASAYRSFLHIAGYSLEPESIVFTGNDNDTSKIVRYLYDSVQCVSRYSIISASFKGDQVLQMAHQRAACLRSYIFLLAHRLGDVPSIAPILKHMLISLLTQQQRAWQTIRYAELRLRWVGGSVEVVKRKSEFRTITVRAAGGRAATSLAWSVDLLSRICASDKNDTKRVICEFINGHGDIFLPFDAVQVRDSSLATFLHEDGKYGLDPMLMALMWKFVMLGRVSNSVYVAFSNFLQCTNVAIHHLHDSFDKGKSKSSLEAIRKMSLIAMKASANVATPIGHIHMRSLSSSIVRLTQLQLSRHLSLLQTRSDDGTNCYYHLPAHSTLVFGELDSDNESVVVQTGRRAEAEYLVLKWSECDQKLVRSSQLYNAWLIGLMQQYDLLCKSSLDGTSMSSLLIPN